MEAQSKTSRGPNLNPLAPAQSKRTFSFSGETRNSIKHASISAPFFLFFLHLFQAFSGKAEKAVQDPAPELYKYVKMDFKGAKTEPKNQQSEPQGPTKYEKHAKLPTNGGKVERQVLQWSPRAPSSRRKAQKGFRNCQ